MGTLHKDPVVGQPRPSITRSSDPSGDVALGCHLVNGKNVGMIQDRCGTGFLLEAAQAVGIGGQRLRQNLDGNFAVRPSVMRAIDFAHAASAQRGADFILSEDCTGSQSHEE